MSGASERVGHERDGDRQVERKRLNCVLRIWGSQMRGSKDEALGFWIFEVNLADLIQQYVFYGEFDSGSERTLAACLRHASCTECF